MCHARKGILRQSADRFIEPFAPRSFGDSAERIAATAARRTERSPQNPQSSVMPRQENPLFAKADPRGAQLLLLQDVSSYSS